MLSLLTRPAAEPMALRRTFSRSGRELVVRHLIPTDRDRLLAFFAGLTPRTRRLRYLGPGGQEFAERETERLLSAFASEHLVLLAVAGQHAAAGEVIGIGELVPTPGSPPAADIAATVADEAQGDGVGSALLRQLVEAARMRGYRRLEFDVAAENGAVRHLVKKSGLLAQARYSYGTIHYSVALDGYR